MHYRKNIKVCAENWRPESTVQCSCACMYIVHAKGRAKGWLQCALLFLYHTIPYAHMRLRYRSRRSVVHALEIILQSHSYSSASYRITKRVVLISPTTITPPSNLLACTCSMQITHHQLPFVVDICGMPLRTTPQKPKSYKASFPQSKKAVCTKWRELPELYLAE